MEVKKQNKTNFIICPKKTVQKHLSLCSIISAPFIISVPVQPVNLNN